MFSVVEVVVVVVVSFEFEFELFKLLSNVTPASDVLVDDKELLSVDIFSKCSRPP